MKRQKCFLKMLISAYDICSVIRYLFADDVTYHNLSVKKSVSQMRPGCCTRRSSTVLSFSRYGTDLTVSEYDPVLERKIPCKKEKQFTCPLMNTLQIVSCSEYQISNFIIYKSTGGKSWISLGITYYSLVKRWYVCNI